MKKFIFTIISIVTVISLSSCGKPSKNANADNLIRMRDSIQSIIDWQEEEIESEFHYLDSLYNNDRELYKVSHSFYMNSIEGLQENVKDCRNKIFQINLELNK